MNKLSLSFYFNNQCLNLIFLAMIMFVGCIAPGNRIAETGTGISIFSKYGAKMPQEFFDTVDNYVEELLLALGTEHKIKEHLRDLEVIFVPYEPDNYWVGVFAPPNEIYIMVNDTVSELSVFGHEFIRYIEFLKGNNHWRQSSLTWQGEMGQLWNMAESLAQPFVFLEVAEENIKE